jgi:cytochrome P450
MLLYPSAVAKARVEIDRVIGKGRAQRLPDFGDRPELVYVEAFYREVMRWRPATPLGVRHAASQDDVYEGFFIPKGLSV